MFFSSVEGGFQSWQIWEFFDVFVFGVQFVVDGGVGLFFEVVLFRFFVSLLFDKFKGCGFVFVVSGDSVVVVVQGWCVGFVINGW